MISTYLRGDPNLSEDAAAAFDEVIKATYEGLRNVVAESGAVGRRRSRAWIDDMAKSELLDR